MPLSSSSSALPNSQSVLGGHHHFDMFVRISKAAARVFCRALGIGHYARMERELMAMNDHQLADIGLDRSDIYTVVYGDGGRDPVNANSHRRAA